MTTSAEQLAHNLHVVRRRIAAAAGKAGRDPGEIRLIAASKTMPAGQVAQAMTAGQQDFGENYLQELLDKQELLGDRQPEWHFIGHLQSNKAKQAAGRFAWLHTLDNLRLAEKLSAAVPSAQQALNVLLQVNVANDPSKYGLMTDQVLPFAETLLNSSLPGIRLRGLMTIGRQAASRDERRAEFINLRELAGACGRSLGAGYFTELSMGMSDDFEMAIEEGATMVRIGSLIFGAR